MWASEVVWCRVVELTGCEVSFDCQCNLLYDIQLAPLGRYIENLIYKDGKARRVFDALPACNQKIQLPYWKRDNE